MIDDDVTPFSPSGALPDPGPVTSYQRPPDPYANPVPKITPEQYVVNALTRAARSRRGLAHTPHISTQNGTQYSQPMLLQAEAIDMYLANGAAGYLTIDQIGWVVDALGEPEAGAPLAGTATERSSWDREKKRQMDELIQLKWYAERDRARGKR